MTTKEILLEQFNTCYDENGWFVALKNALQNLSVEAAIWKTENLDNSIWEILSHLNFYNERYLRRFKGESIPQSNIENSETFASVENATEDAWQAEVEKFDAIMSEWRNLIESVDEAHLQDKVSNENQSSWANLIAYINTHNAHHGGQIVLIRKLQGNWDRSQGVS